MEFTSNSIIAKDLLIRLSMNDSNNSVNYKVYYNIFSNMKIACPFSLNAIKGNKLKGKKRQICMNQIEFHLIKRARVYIIGCL